MVAGRGETRTVGTLEISTDSRPSQQREDRLTFIRCRVAPRNMHEIRWKRARYAFGTESNDAVFPINTWIHPSTPPYTRRRESYLETCLYPIYHYFSDLVIVSFNPLCIGRNIRKVFRLIILYSKEWLDKSRTIWKGINFLKRYLTLKKFVSIILIFLHINYSVLHNLLTIVIKKIKYIREKFCCSLM